MTSIKSDAMHHILNICLTPRENHKVSIGGREMYRGRMIRPPCVRIRAMINET